MFLSVSRSIRHFLAVFPIGLLALLVMFSIARAGSIGGNLEYTYNNSESTTTDKMNGTTDTTRSNTFSQRYNVTLTQELLPLLNFNAGTVLDLNESSSNGSAGASKSSSQALNSNANLSLTNSHLGGGLGYSRRSERPGNNIVEIYNGNLRFNPDGLPNLNLSGSRLHNYDKTRLLTDTVSDSLSISSNYTPIPQLTLNYNSSLSASDARLSDTTTSSSLHSMRASYSESFLNNRVTLNTDYSVSFQESGAKSGSGQLPPQPLSSVVTWRQNQATTLKPLVAFDDPTMTTLDSPNNLAITLINPGGTPQQNSARLLAADLGLNSDRPSIVRLVVGTASDIDNAFLKLKSYNAGINFQELVARLNGAVIKWYSSDNGSDWTEFSPGGGNVLLYSGDASDPYYYFDYTLTGFSRRYLMCSIAVDTAYMLPVVTGVTAQTLTINGVRLLKAVPANVRSLSSKQTSGMYNLGMRVQLTKTPAINYDFSLQMNHLKKGGAAMSIDYTLVNGIGLNHRFSEKLGTSARITRQDSEQAKIRHSGNSWGASLNYKPLQNLDHTLVYSGRYEENEGLSSHANGVNITNSANLYEGVAVNLSGGANSSTSEEGVTGTTVTLAAGANVEPHPRLNIGIGCSQNSQKSTGGGKPDQSSQNRQGSLNVNFRPLDNLFVFGTYSYSEQSNSKPQSSTSFGGSWSPFRDGKVQLGINYSESITSSGTKDRSFSQSIHWDIRPGTALDIGRSQMTSSSTTSLTEGVNYYAALRMSL